MLLLSQCLPIQATILGYFINHPNVSTLTIKQIKEMFDLTTALSYTCVAPLIDSQFNVCSNFNELSVQLLLKDSLLHEYSDDDAVSFNRGFHSQFKQFTIPITVCVENGCFLYCVVFLSCCKCTNKENDFVSCSYQFKDSNAYHSLFEREKDNDPGRSILNTDSIIICLDNRRSGSIFGLS